MERVAISIREAAQLVGLTEGTIRRWIDVGRIHAVKLGDERQSRVRIPYPPFAELFGLPLRPHLRRRASDAQFRRECREAEVALIAARRCGRALP